MFRHLSQSFIFFGMLASACALAQDPYLRPSLEVRESLANADGALPQLHVAMTNANVVNVRNGEILERRHGNGKGWPNPVRRQRTGRQPGWKQSTCGAFTSRRGFSRATFTAPRWQLPSGRWCPVSRRPRVQASAAYPDVALKRMVNSRSACRP